jgi:hypothetical protein
MITERLGTIFHETLSLSRQSIFQIVQSIANDNNVDKPRKPNFDSLKKQTNLGPNYIKAMPRYARGCGILDQKNSLTAFGKYINLRDSLLDQTGTQWLMHYHLSAPQGPGAAFWSEIVSKHFYSGNLFTPEDIVDTIGNFIWQTENKVLADRAIRSTSTIFLGTYTKPEGLGKLRLLEVTDSGRYRVREPVPAPAWAVGYALLDYWETYYPGRLTIGLDTLQDGPFPKLFMLGKADLDDVLQTLQETRCIDIHRTAPPYQVVLLRTARESYLEKLYGNS